MSVVVVVVVVVVAVAVAVVVSVYNGIKLSVVGADVLLVTHHGDFIVLSEFLQTIETNKNFFYNTATGTARTSLSYL